MGKDAENNGEKSKDKSKKQNKDSKGKSDAETYESDTTGSSKPTGKAGKKAGSENESKSVQESSDATKLNSEKGGQPESESGSKASSKGAKADKSLKAGKEVVDSSKTDKNSKPGSDATGSSKASDKGSKANSDMSADSKSTDKGSKPNSDVSADSKSTDKGSKPSSDVSGDSKSTDKGSKPSSDVSGDSKSTDKGSKQGSDMSEQTKASDNSSKGSSKPESETVSGSTKTSTTTGSDVKSSRVELDASSSKFLNAKSVSKATSNPKSEKEKKASGKSEKKSDKSSKGKPKNEISEDEEVENEKEKDTKRKSKSGKKTSSGGKGSDNYVDDKKSKKSKRSKKSKKSKKDKKDKLPKGDDEGNSPHDSLKNDKKKSHKSGKHKHHHHHTVSPTSTKADLESADLGGGTSTKSNILKITPKNKHSKVDFAGCKIGFIGAGKMTEAISRGLVVYGKVSVSKLFVGSKSVKNLDNLRTKGINITKRIYDIFGQCDCDVVFLSIHGHVIRACFKQGGSRPQALAVNYIPNQKHPVYILSLITGVSLSDIRQTLLNPDDPEKYAVEMHRIMLNIGVAYGIGMGLLDVEPDSKVCSPVVRDLLMKLARIEYFPEETMDAACAVGGNGLAFSFYFLSAIANGGFKMGLSKQLATRLAAKTLQSACQCLLESNKHPSELQDSVTSSAGPAIYGLNVLEKTDCAAGFQSAVDAAYQRIKDLSTINSTGAAP